MTDRLKTALKHLNDDELEQVTRLAESLVHAKDAAPASAGSSWKFQWVGALRDRPEQSGVEAQQAAIRQWIDLVRGKESA